MKNKLIYATIFALAICIYSCSKSNEKIQEAVVDNQEPVKTLKIFADDNESYMVLDIMDPDLVDLTEDNFKIKTSLVTEEELTQLKTDAEPASEVVEEETFEDNPTQVLVSRVNLANNHNALQVDVIFNEMLRGTGALEITYDGVDDTPSCPKNCVRGFTGYPYNCDHTHWKLKKKNGSGSLFWNTLYNAKSTNSSTTIHYYTSSTYYKWRLRIDPDKNCNYHASYSMIFQSCCP